MILWYLNHGVEAASDGKVQLSCYYQQNLLRKLGGIACYQFADQQDTDGWIDSVLDLTFGACLSAAKEYRRGNLIAGPCATRTLMYTVVRTNILLQEGRP
jgi:hypothetical protein